MVICLMTLHSKPTGLLSVTAAMGMHIKTVKLSTRMSMELKTKVTTATTCTKLPAVLSTISNLFQKTTAEAK